MTVFIAEYIGTIGVRADIFDRDDMGSSHWLATVPEVFYEPGDYLEDPMRSVFLAVEKWANVHIPPESLSLACREKPGNDGRTGGGAARE